MKRLTFCGQKGSIASILLVILLLAAVVLGILLVQNRTSFLPKAENASPGPEAGYSLKTKSSSEINAGSTFKVDLLAATDIDEANLFVAKLKFNPEFLEVSDISNSFLQTRIPQPDPYLKNWIEKKFDNAKGTITLTAGIPSPGIKTSPDNPAILATFTFKAKLAGSTGITFEDTSEIYRDTDNVNILSSKKELLLVIKKSKDAEAGGKLLLTPSRSPLSKGCEYQVAINFDTGGAKVDGIDSVLQFDPQKFEITSLERGNVFSSYPGNIIKQSEGVILISGLSLPGRPISGKGLLGKINLKVNPNSQNGYSEIKFMFDSENKAKTNDSNIVETGGARDLLNSVVNGRFNINSGICSPISSEFAGDGNNDGSIDYSDLSLMLSNYKKSPENAPNLDFNGDGNINIFDLTKLIGLIVG